MANFRTIEFNGRTFQSFGFFLKKDNDYIDFADLNVETKQVEGSLNGADLSSAVSEENIERIYTFKTIPTKLPYQNEAKFLKVFVDFITGSRNDYKILKDSARKGYYCYAFLKSVSSIKKQFDGCFEISVTFSCRPYWYREISDDIELVINNNPNPVSVPVYNPEKFTAYPYIKIQIENPPSGVVNNGMFIQNGTDYFDVIKINDYIELDSEKKNAYKGTVGQNNFVDLLNYPEFPKIKPGQNTLIFTTHSNAKYTITIKPRWRCL